MIKKHREKIKRILAGNPALARSVRAYLDQRAKITLKEWRKTVLPTLRSVENDIITRIKSYNLSEWDIANLNNILGQVQAIITTFGTQYTEAVISGQEVTSALASKSITREIALIGLNNPLGNVVTQDLLAALKPMTDVFTSVFTSDLSKIVKSEITTGIINGDSTSVVAKRIRDNFGNTSERIVLLKNKKADLQQQLDLGLINKKEYDLKVGKINQQLDKGSMMSYARAERIAMTEMNRASSFTREIRGRQIMETNPEARRMWINLHKPGARAEHIAVESVTRENPIKLDAPFNVAGHSAQFPLDPALPVGQIVNCGCIIVIVNPKQFGDLGTLRGDRLTPTRITNK